MLSMPWTLAYFQTTGIFQTHLSLFPHDWKQENLLDIFMENYWQNCPVYSGPRILNEPTIINVAVVQNQLHLRLSDPIIIPVTVNHLIYQRNCCELRTQTSGQWIYKPLLQSTVCIYLPSQLSALDSQGPFDCSQSLKKRKDPASCARFISNCRWISRELLPWTKRRIIYLCLIHVHL